MFQENMFAERFPGNILIKNVVTENTCHMNTHQDTVKVMRRRTS
jgi:hypothetical protein